MKIVADASVIINGLLAEQIESGSVRNADIIVPQAVLDVLQFQASSRQEQGLVGLDRLDRLKRASSKYGLSVHIEGRHLGAESMELAGSGMADSATVDAARDCGATLYTSDAVQRMVAAAQDVQTVFLRESQKRAEPSFVRYFESDTMSVHLKEEQKPLAKTGSPGSSELVTLKEEPTSRGALREMAAQILDAAESSGNMLEMSKTGASVVQYGSYRIAITHPPFSESLEITIVHPTTKMSLEEYGLPESLMGSLRGKAEGVVIAGSPGSGKSTLASGLANFYSRSGKVVKTLESPRDLQVDPDITQYGKIDGSFEDAADILLLVRPDYTIFDEVRRREDFAVFADLRMSGVGMVGVVHATAPLDAIQRFIGKIELGMIPNVLDTVLFVDGGKVAKVYGLKLVVKVPTGMTESDLARPVIEVRDFGDGALEHEIYTFGEENVIVPVSGDAGKTGVERLAEDRIADAFRRYDPGVRVTVRTSGSAEVAVYERSIPAIIGRGGSNIEEMQKELGMHLDVVPRKNAEPHGDDGMHFSLSESRGALYLTVDRAHTCEHAEIYSDGECIGPARVGRKGQIKIPRHSRMGRRLSEADPDGIRIVPKD